MPRTIRIQDTLTKSLRELEPREPGRVGIYACGPTVYSRVHVGNARPYVVFSLLKRFLEHEGYDVTFVANVTDVNDKIYDAAREAGEPSAELARDMLDHYVADTDRLGLGRPDAEPKATDTIEPIVALIQALLSSDHAYAAGGDVYFRVSSFPGYGKLSNRRLEEMDQGEPDDRSELKESPQDFALWKAHKPGEDTSWDAPWGRGRPGWHIECSAMAEEILGLDFDIHGGGNDLVFPHHENEIAQTEAARQRRLARIWMHNGMLQFEREKMAKSVGNIRSLADVLDEHGRDALIMLFLATHYRRPLSYTEAAMEQAALEVKKIRELTRRLEPDGPAPGLSDLEESFYAALADDFNTPEARAVLFSWVSEVNRRLDAGERLGPGELRGMLWVLGLENLLEADDERPPPEAIRLLQERQAARAAGDYELADQKRDRLAELGWQVRDTPDGQRLVRST